MDGCVQSISWYSCRQGGTVRSRRAGHDGCQWSCHCLQCLVELNVPINMPHLATSSHYCTIEAHSCICLTKAAQLLPLTFTSPQLPPSPPQPLTPRVSTVQRSTSPPTFSPAINKPLGARSRQNSRFQIRQIHRQHNSFRPPARQPVKPCAQSSHPSPAASSAVVRYWRLFNQHLQRRHRARARAGTSWSRRHTLRTCSRRRYIPPHLLPRRRYRYRGRTAVEAGVVEKKEK